MIVMILGMIKVLGIIELMMVVTKYTKTVSNTRINISQIGKDSSITCPI